MDRLHVIVSRSAGTCFGVEAAIALALRLKKPILGPLVHNPLVVAELAREGIPVLERYQDVDSLVAAGIREVVITAHGYPLELKTQLTRAGIRYHDATCPVLLKSVYRRIQRFEGEGRAVILIGNPEHAEVIASKSHGSRIRVVYSDADVDGLPPDMERPVAICQTTITDAKLDHLVEAIRRRFAALEVVDTRCKPVRSQQAAVEELARWVDAMVVVGGLESSNTTNLARLARRFLPDRTYHVDRADRIDGSWLEGIRNLGVAAGTSTPRRQIEEVTDRIVRLAPVPAVVSWGEAGAPDAPHGPESGR